MPLSDKGMRNLPYPLSKTYEPIADTPNDGTPQPVISGFPDTTTKIPITMTLSLDEYVALATAIDVGRDIAFAEDSELIWWVWCRAFSEAVIMSCVEIINCINTDADTIAAIQQLLANAGFAPSGNGNLPNPSQNVTMTPSQAAGNLLPSGYSCVDEQMMATSRQIVLELNAAVMDFFEAVEFMTNPVEAANIATDGIPVAGTINNIPEFLDWMIESIAESYQAAYTQEAENVIACDIFCAMRVNCEITYQMLIDVYEPLAQGQFGTLPTDINDFQSIADWALSLSMGVSLGAVAAMHLILLYAMKFGTGSVFQMAGLTSLKSIISMTQGYSDMSYVECDCFVEPTPTTYWALYYDWRQGLFGSSSIGTIYASSAMHTLDGWCVNPDVAATLSRTSYKITDLGAQYIIKASATRSLRRGSIGNGANDVSATTFYPNANLAGTPTAQFGGGSVTLNTNDATLGAILPLATGLYQSFQHWEGTSGDPNGTNPTGRLKVYEQVIWGLAGAGNTKPPNAVWAGNVLPATLPELFPPFTP